MMMVFILLSNKIYLFFSQGQLPGLSVAFPSTMFGLFALVAGIVMYWMPETLYAPMHQTIQQAE